MVDEVNLLFDRLQGVIQDALEVIESTVNAEKIAQLRALRVTVTGLEKGNIPVPSALADLVAELEQTEKEQAVAQATLEACRGRLAGINDLLGKLRHSRTVIRHRASSNACVPLTELRRLTLETLGELGGSARAGDVLDLIQDKLKDRLQPDDLEPNAQGLPRWRVRTAHVRGRLVAQGLLKSDSPKFVWELADGADAGEG